MASDGEAAEAAAAPAGRRVIPLREITLPHRCPRPVRLYVLARAPYFAGSSDEELNRIDRLMQTGSWAAGSYVYHAGDPADALYVVAEGRVRLTHLTEDGVETVIDILGPGEMFGTLATLGEPRHRNSASTLVGSCTLRIEQDDFRDVLATQPGVALRVLDDVVERLARAQADIGGQATATVAQRTATALLRMADKFGVDRGDGGTLIEVPLSRTDLAGLARSTPESVSRVMSRWRKEGLIDTGRRWTSVLDRRRLQAAAAGASAGAAGPSRPAT